MYYGSTRKLIQLDILISVLLLRWMGFPGGSVVKNLPANAGDVGLIPGLERSSGEGKGSPLQCFCLVNQMDRRTWRAIVHGVTRELDTT